MPTRVVTVTVSSIGTSAGPFNISDDVLGIIASNVTRSQLLAGYNVNTDVKSTKIVVESTGTCTSSLTIFLATPTPTPTVIIPTPTPTPSPTPTSGFAVFDNNYTGYSNICGEGGRAWTRLVAAPGTTVEIYLEAQHYVTGITGTSACIYGALYTTTLPSVKPSIGTLLLPVYKSVLAANVPQYLGDGNYVVVTIPPTGYQDLMIVYTTTNLSTGFTNGSLTALITSINGVLISGGSFINTNYLCSDTGVCAGPQGSYYPYAISSVGYPTCGEACDSLVDTNITVYAKVPSGADLAGQYLYSDTSGTIWTGGTGGYHRIIKTGRFGFSAQVEPTGYVYSLNTCTSTSPGTCG